MFPVALSYITQIIPDLKLHLIRIGPSLVSLAAVGRCFFGAAAAPPRIEFPLESEKLSKCFGRVSVVSKLLGSAPTTSDHRNEQVERNAVA